MARWLRTRLLGPCHLRVVLAVHLERELVLLVFVVLVQLFGLVMIGHKCVVENLLRGLVFRRVHELVLGVPRVPLDQIDDPSQQDRGSLRDLSQVLYR